MAHLTKEGYLANLIHIREVLINELDNLNKKQDMFYIAEVAIKLRILYLDKSGKESLLKTIEKLYGFNIEVFVNLSTEEKVQRGLITKEIVEGFGSQQLNSVISWFGGGHGPKNKISIFSAIEKSDEIKIGDMYYSYKDIITTIADKMGGAHIDPTVQDDRLVPFFNDILIGGLSSGFRSIYDLARSSIILINIIETDVYNPVPNDFLVKKN